MAHIDWNHWRILYVTGDDSVTLDALSKEPNAPALNTLKKKSSKDSWKEQRERFRHQKIEIVHHDAVASAAAVEVKKIIDSAEMLTRHAQMSKLMGAIAVHEFAQIRKAQQEGKATGLRSSEITSLAKLAVELERLTEGLATQRQQIDLSSMTDSDLEKLANGG